jgi:ParB-like chromosome segregation protein Spo0J
VAGSADAAALLTLLEDATTQGRPALALSRRRAAEVLGTEPDEQWWTDHADTWLAAGWRARVTADVVTFVPADEQVHEPVEVRIAVRWSDPAGPPTHVTVDGRALELTEPDAQEIARLAARLRAAGRNDVGGGSGI